MRLGLDARMMGFTGIGRHISALMEWLPRIRPEWQLVYFVRPQDRAELAQVADNVEVIETIDSYYDRAEQTTHRQIMEQAQLDLLHVPHFNAPLFYRGPMIVTIHDLIQAKFASVNTLPAMVKKLGYQLIIRRALAKARQVIAVSEYTKQDIVASFGTSADKIRVIPNGIEPRFAPRDFSAAEVQAVLNRQGIAKPFLLYVGLHSHHKNLARLIEAVARLHPSTHGRHPEPVEGSSRTMLRQAQHDTPPHTPSLVLAGKRDPRYTPQLEKLAADLGIAEQVHFLGFVPDQDLQVLYQTAEAFVFPSLYEGFGIPPLEALAMGTPVLSSNAASLPEVLGSHAAYFDPEDVDDLHRLLRRILTGTKLPRVPITFPEFKWEKVVREVVGVYEQTLAAQPNHG